jgi:hypothetical protein
MSWGSGNIRQNLSCLVVFSPFCAAIPDSDIPSYVSFNVLVFSWIGLGNRDRRPTLLTSIIFDTIKTFSPV